MIKKFYNALVCIYKENTIKIEYGDVWTNDKLICSVCENNPKLKADEEINCNGNLLIPGFINSHTHSAMSFLRTFSEGVPLQEWLTKKIFPYEAKLTSEDIYTLTKLSILEYLSGGITEIFDMYIDPISVAKACSDLGLRANVMSGVNNFTSSVKQVEAEQSIAKAFGELITYKFGFHAPYTCSEDLLKEISEFSNEKKIPIFSHVSETKKELDDYLNYYGKTPLEYLASLGLFNYGGGVFHMVWPDRDDISILKNYNISVCTNPASNCKLASGIAPLKTYLENDINVCIGTDGPASNNALNIFREMYLAFSLSNIKYNDANSIDALEVFKMSNINASKMLGNASGLIQKGNKADFVLLDINKPNMYPRHDILRNIVLTGSNENVAMTVVDGKILYKDGQYFLKNNESIEEIINSCEKITKRITE